MPLTRHRTDGRGHLSLCGVTPGLLFLWWYAVQTEYLHVLRCICPTATEVHPATLLSYTSIIHVPSSGLHTKQGMRDGIRLGKLPLGWLCTVRQCRPPACGWRASAASAATLNNATRSHHGQACGGRRRGASAAADQTQRGRPRHTQSSMHLHSNSSRHGQGGTRSHSGAEKASTEECTPEQDHPQRRANQMSLSGKKNNSVQVLASARANLSPGKTKPASTHQSQAAPSTVAVPCTTHATDGAEARIQRARDPPRPRETREGTDLRNGTSRCRRRAPAHTSHASRCPTAPCTPR